MIKFNHLFAGRRGPGCVQTDRTISIVDEVATERKAGGLCAPGGGGVGTGVADNF